MNIGAIRKDGKFSFVYNDYAVQHIVVNLAESENNAECSLKHLENTGSRLGFPGVTVWYYEKTNRWYVDWFDLRGRIMLRMMYIPEWIESIVVNQSEIVYKAPVYKEEPESTHHYHAEVLNLI